MPYVNEKREKPKTALEIKWRSPTVVHNRSIHCATPLLKLLAGPLHWEVSWLIEKLVGHIPPGWWFYHLFISVTGCWARCHGGGITALAMVVALGTSGVATWFSSRARKWYLLRQGNPRVSAVELGMWEGRQWPFLWSSRHSIQDSVLSDETSPRFIYPEPDEVSDWVFHSLFL